MTQKFAFWLDNEKARQDKVEPIFPSVKHTGYYGDAGVDLYTPIDFTVEPGSFRVIDTYVGFRFSVGIAAIVKPRGGDVHLVGSGVIDTGYTGTIKVRVVNPYKEKLEFKRGDSIGQLVPFVKAFSDGMELVEFEKKHDWVGGMGRGDTGRISGELSL